MINLQKELTSIQKLKKDLPDHEFRLYLKDYLNTMAFHHEESLAEALNMWTQNLSSSLQNYILTPPEADVLCVGYNTDFSRALAPLSRFKNKPYMLPKFVVNQRDLFPEQPAAAYGRLEDERTRMILGNRIVRIYEDLYPEIISDYTEKVQNIGDKVTNNISKLAADLVQNYHEHKGIKRRLIEIGSDREVSLQTFGNSLDDLEVYYGLTASGEEEQVTEAEQVAEAEPVAETEQIREAEQVAETEQVAEAEQAASETIKSEEADISTTHSISESCGTENFPSLVDLSSPTLSDAPSDLNSNPTFKFLPQIKSFSQIKETDSPQIVGMVRGVNSHHVLKDYNSQSRDHARFIKNLSTRVGQHLRDHTYNQDTVGGFVRGVNERKMSEVWKEKHDTNNAPPPPFACIGISTSPLIFEPKSWSRPMTSSFLGISFLMAAISGLLVWKFKSNYSNFDANSKKDEL